MQQPHGRFLDRSVLAFPQPNFRRNRRRCRAHAIQILARIRRGTKPRALRGGAAEQHQRHNDRQSLVARIYRTLFHARSTNLKWVMGTMAQRNRRRNPIMVRNAANSITQPVISWKVSAVLVEK